MLIQNVKFPFCLSLESLLHWLVGFLHSRWKVQLLNNSWSRNQFLSFLFCNSRSFLDFSGGTWFKFLKPGCFGLFHFGRIWKLTPLHCSNKHFFKIYMDSIFYHNWSKLSSRKHQPWILWLSFIFLDKDLCVSSLCQAFRKTGKITLVLFTHTIVFKHSHIVSTSWIEKNVEKNVYRSNHLKWENIYNRKVTSLPLLTTSILLRV